MNLQKCLPAEACSQFANEFGDFRTFGWDFLTYCFHEFSSPWGETGFPRNGRNQGLERFLFQSGFKIWIQGQNEMFASDSYAKLLAN